MTPGVAHFTIYNATTAGGAPNAHGTYNHGPMITSFNGTFLTSWYNSPKDESSQMRSVFAYSADGQAWSEPLVAFPNFTANGVENGPWTTLNGRLYTQSGSEDAGLHKETIVSIMRRVSVPSSATAPPTLGPPFWLNATVPAAFVGLGFRTYLQMDDETRADAEQYLPGSFRTRAPLLPAAACSSPSTFPNGRYLASAVRTLTRAPDAAGNKMIFNERSLYKLPSAPGAPARLFNLIRTDQQPRFLFGSTCELPPLPSLGDEAA
jgi:hypothetical protein